MAAGKKLSKYIGGGGFPTADLTTTTGAACESASGTFRGLLATGVSDLKKKGKLHDAGTARWASAG